MMKKYALMWCGHLGEINTTQHSIDLVQGAKPVSQASYRAGHHAREIINDKFKKMLETDFIEP